MQRVKTLRMYGRHNKCRLSVSETRTKSYREEFLRRRQLNKAFKGTEKGIKVMPKLSETIHNGMEVLWRQKLMCDVVIYTADGMLLRAHKIVLASSSDYFYDAFVESEPCHDEAGVIECCSVRCTDSITVPGISGKVFEVILEALYTAKVKVEASNVDDLLSSAFDLGIFSLVDACEEFLVDLVGKENCLQFLKTAFTYNLVKLTDTAVGICAKNFQHISKKAAFKNLDVDHLIMMFQRGDLDVSSELDVFHKMRIWIEENKESRLQHAGELMSTIRLPLLDTTVVVDTVESCGYLMEVPQCQKYVKEALHYHCMPARQCVLQSPRTVPRQTSEVSLLVVGGAPRGKNDVISDEVLKLNTANNEWDFVTRLPQPRHHHAVAVFNDFLYVAGGESTQDHSTTMKNVCRYDPRNRSWTDVANLNYARHSFQMVHMSGSLYVVGGGIGRDDCLATVERYNPAVDRWEEVASLSAPRRCVAVATMGGRLYAVGGTGNDMILGRVEKYFPNDNRWDVLNPVNFPRIFGHLVNLNSNLYLVGGATVDKAGNVVCVEAIERFSMPANQWTVITKLRDPRSEFGCSVFNGKLYLIGGYNWDSGQRLASAQCFDMDTYTMFVLPDIPRPLTGLEAATISLFGHFGKHVQFPKHEGNKASA